MGAISRWSARCGAEEVCEEFEGEEMDSRRHVERTTASVERSSSAVGQGKEGEGVEVKSVGTRVTRKLKLLRA